jgi:hypothetical protein
MSRHRHPIGAVSGATGYPNTYTTASPEASVQGSGQAIELSTGPPSEGAAQASSINYSDLAQHLEEALKNTGFTAEIVNEGGGLRLFEIVESDTGKVILQLPTKTALAIVASLRKSNPSGRSADLPADLGSVFSELA